MSAVSTRPAKRLWGYAQGHRPRIWVATTYSILNKIFDLAPPLLIGLAIDIVANDGNGFMAAIGPDSVRAQIVWLSLLSFIIWSLESVFEYLYRVAWRNLAQDVQHDLRLDTYERVQELDHQWYEDRSTGDLLAVMNDDVNQLERFLDIGANEVIQVTTTVLVVGASFFYIAPDIAWWSIVPIPFIAYTAIWFQRKLEPRYATVRDQAGFLNSQLANNVLGMSTVKSFVAERREHTRIEGESNAYRDANRSAIKLSSMFTPLIRIVILIGFTGTLVAGGLQALDGALSVGEYSTMMYMSQRLLWPLTRLGETFDQYQRAMASTNRILDVLEAEPGILSGSAPLSLAVGEGEIVYHDVTFAYDEAGPAVRHLDLIVPAGRTTAIVGPTGSGKSTMVKLLLRFYDPSSGTITLDGQPIDSLVLHDLRAATGLVSQDVYLFHGNVRDNIAYGRPDATEAQIVHAAQAAEAHDFVMALPEGYDTIVGERGQKLSGGQRQRLSIARAVLKDPPILLLDEATSAVDNETEAAIQRSLDTISQNRTTLVIAHRLSTIRNADRIHVLDAGSIVESGSHDELVALGGHYTRLWKVQTGDRS